MTRINLVPVRELSDQHCFAEFRELTRVPKHALQSVNKHGLAGTLKRIPTTFALGTGHVMFFYDKGQFLLDRFEALKADLRRRGYNFKDIPLDEYGVFEQHKQLRQPYVPTPEAIALSRARLAERVAARPDWYRFT